MNYVFFGNNVPLAERLRKALGTGVIECITLLQMKNTLLPAEEMDYCVFIEKTDPTLNIPAIMHLHKTFQNIYIVLIAPEMTREEKISYLQAGTYKNRKPYSCCLLVSTCRKRGLCPPA